MLSTFAKSLRSTSRLPWRMSTAPLSTDGKIQNVVVVGSGLMGNGIVQVSAATGHKVVMVDQKEEILQKATASIEKSVGRVLKKKVPDAAEAAEKLAAIMANITVSTDANAAVADADLVIEAITENLGAKQGFFKSIEAAAPADCIFASNTSSLPIADISEPMQDTSRERFGGLHFFNPVPMMKLVEVVRGPSTTDTTFDALTAFGKAVGKVPVACRDTPGFIVNRLLVPYMFESIRMVERGDATMEDVDVAMKLGAGYPMGPFELGDYVGLDTMKFIADGWHEAHPEEPLFAPSELLNKHVAEGKFGRKSGEGFYKY